MLRINNVERTGMQKSLASVSVKYKLLGLYVLDNTGHDQTQNVTLTYKLKITKHERVVTQSTGQCDCVGRDITVPFRLVSEEH